MKIRLSAINVTCPVCKAEPGDSCAYRQRQRGQITRFGSHWARIEAAQQAEHVANVLVDS